MRMHRAAIVVLAAAALSAPSWAQSAAQDAPRGGTAPATATGTSGTATATGGAVNAGTTGTTGTSAARPEPASRPASTGSYGNSPEYRLTAGDKLRVEVYKDPQLSQALQIRPDGKITLPLIGDVQAAGLTPIELRDQLATALKEYVTNPVVTVIVVETVPPAVFVMGEVNNPGSIAMQGPMTVMQALAMAGGFKDFANTKNIRILRKSRSGVRTIPFNYKSASKGEAEMVLLAPGDTVVVP